MSDNHKYDESRRAGRPSEKLAARDNLISAARTMFTVHSYEKVSTRMLAEKAGVNVAMIRYYFGNKAGLFEAMVRETIEPIKKQVNQFVAASNQKELKDIMRAYYANMSAAPMFPRLIFQTMHMEPSAPQRQLLEKVLFDILRPVQDALFDSGLWEPVIRPDMDPKLCKVSFLSLMIFPFIAPQSMCDLHGIERNNEFLDALLEHNLKVLTHGFIRPELSDGEDHDSES
ncbi:TetR family transcriptional regulator [Vibrio albus]|uniref:TetR family transcriptional regulator n=1 Tax=Vibrio albus TaxID=2200953 RepID=A0A2U3B5H1_9VIBR|nr:TetR/AcrR family transcriptional regulator [Vibrio albus]PWI32039.1 TetR family transcriptional regulator [Vibrio albus]